MPPWHPLIISEMGNRTLFIPSGGQFAYSVSAILLPPTRHCQHVSRRREGLSCLYRTYGLLLLLLPLSPTLEVCRVQSSFPRSSRGSEGAGLGWELWDSVPALSGFVCTTHSLLLLLLPGQGRVFRRHSFFIVSFSRKPEGMQSVRFPIPEVIRGVQRGEKVSHN